MNSRPRSLHALVRALPEGRAGHLAALGLLVAALLAAWLLVVAPLLDAYVQRAQGLALQRQAVTRMDRLAAALPALRQSASASAPRPALLIGGATDAIASANLQDLLQQAASANGATLSTAENVPAAMVGRYQRIGLHIVVAASYRNLVRLIATLERSSPAVVIDGLHIHKSDNEDAAANMMECDMSVYAFRRNENRPTPPPSPETQP
ncbi:type II secretion system protein GspM [Gluconacetobacter diazotrophicus]|nr:type II secretion system protein GspM [Gluconacetobacter diazotrophicus]